MLAPLQAARLKHGKFLVLSAERVKGLRCVVHSTQDSIPVYLSDRAFSTIHLISLIRVVIMVTVLLTFLFPVSSCFPCGNASK